ncbi:MAG: hypothetical protein OXH76_24425 [Boseongicola sp.]|nr:hypothetical protein [Boseongicola sp.]
MTSSGEVATFARTIRASFEKFRHNEQLLRQQYARTDESPEVQPKYLLEQATRRHLIDELLNALDWSPKDPSQISEEARSKTDDGKRCYFDYLGLHSQTAAPALVFEAKGFDVSLPRSKDNQKLGRGDMSILVATAVNAIKRGEKSIPVDSEWAEFLQSICTYVRSLDDLGQATLQRAVISSGRWMIVFKRPTTAFCDNEPVAAEDIHCFTSLSEILSRHSEVYQLLHRGNVVDTLPFVLKASDAIKMIPPDEIGDCFRASVVTTRLTGMMKQPYPTRSIYPSIIVNSGDRVFAIVEYSQFVEEPRSDLSFSDFISKLEECGRALERRLAKRFGRLGSPLPVMEFPGFPERASLIPPFAPISPVPSSAAARHDTDGQDRKLYVADVDRTEGADEYVIVTGTEWFYKRDQHIGSHCRFHSWKNARDEHVAAPNLHEGYVEDSFAEDGSVRHCANEDLRNLRHRKCHIQVVESHMCCQACLFAPICWKKEDDRRRLPCPSGDPNPGK